MASLWSSNGTILPPPSPPSCPTLPLTETLPFPSRPSSLRVTALGTEGEDEEEKLERKRRSEKWLSLEEEKRVGEKRRAEERWRRRIEEKRSPEEKAIKEEEENEDFIEVAVAFAVWPSFSGEGER